VQNISGKYLVHRRSANLFGMPLSVLNCSPPSRHGTSFGLVAEHSHSVAHSQVYNGFIRCEKQLSAQSLSNNYVFFEHLSLAQVTSLPSSSRSPSSAARYTTTFTPAPSKIRLPLSARCLLPESVNPVAVALGVKRMGLFAVEGGRAGLCSTASICIYV
jgi:hypothetical protein